MKLIATQDLHVKVQYAAVNRMNDVSQPGLLFDPKRFAHQSDIKR